MAMSFTIAIVGRPNVGKSTLFNRLVGRRLALVDDLPGVTRDRREGQARLGDLDFTIIDTAGLEEADAESLAGRMLAQTKLAIEQADAVFFMLDAKTGPVPDDRAFADLVRRSGKPVIVVANKAEGKGSGARVLEAYELGLGDPVGISAEHGEGLVDLFEALREALPDVTGKPEADAPKDVSDAVRPIRVAVVGRPNSGKSTLVNRLLGEDRMLTGPEAGITRDTIEVDLNWKGRTFHLHDTAGLRRPPRIQEKLEKLSVADTINAIRFAEVVVLLMDAERSVRGAGPAHRRPRRARGPGARHRHLQMGPGRAPRRRHHQAARAGRRAAAAGQGRAGGRRLGADRRGCRPADGGGHGHPRGVEQTRLDQPAQQMA